LLRRQQVSPPERDHRQHDQHIQEHKAHSQLTRSTLLRDRQRESRLERPSHQRALAITGTARHSQAPSIDLCSRRHLQRVDDARGTPDPGGHGARGDVAVEIVEEADPAGGGVGVLLGDEAVGVREDGDL